MFSRVFSCFFVFFRVLSASLVNEVIEIQPVGLELEQHGEEGLRKDADRPLLFSSTAVEWFMVSSGPFDVIHNVKKIK